jgi:hypothetical protein
VILGRTPWLALFIAGCAGAFGAASGSASNERGGSGAVSASGMIGRLDVDVSTSASVRAFAGTPDAIGRPQVFGAAPGVGLSWGMGYGCFKSSGSPRNAARLNNSGGVYCKTIYLINARTHRLGAFWTFSTAFHTLGGTTVGMTRSAAALREGQWAKPSECPPALLETTPSATLAIWGASRVSNLAVESNKHPIGLLFC